MKPELTDEQKQSTLMDMIAEDKDAINDCINFLGIDEKKWDSMFGRKVEHTNRNTPR